LVANQAVVSLFAQPLRTRLRIVEKRSRLGKFH
jgi:hypothetical protein